MWQIDQTTLRYFIAVCEEGSIARAAERECIAAPTISKLLADLETMIGTVLLIRDQKGVHATAAGDVLLKHARLILRRHEHLQAELSEYSAGARGHVRVFANASSMIESLPEALSCFLKENPAVQVDVEERASSEIVRGVQDGFADMGICRDDVPMAELETWTYRFDHLALVVPNAHPLAAETSIDFAQTLDLPHLGLSSNASLNRFTANIAAQMGRELYYRTNVSSFDAAYRCIQAGLAVAILPREAVSPQMQSGREISVIPLTDTWAQKRLVMCVRDRAALTLPAAKLVDCLMAVR
jgi:DNA-binding transcriptional LysR family regulator